MRWMIHNNNNNNNNNAPSKIMVMQDFAKSHPRFAHKMSVQLGLSNLL